eukprot:873759-Pleurochrysis_carterae.AAC.2
MAPRRALHLEAGEDDALVAHLTTLILRTRPQPHSCRCAPKTNKRSKRRDDVSAIACLIVIAAQHAWRNVAW